MTIFKERPALRPILAAALLGLTLPLTAVAADITGAGATFPYPVYAKWSGASG